MNSTGTLHKRVRSSWLMNLMVISLRTESALRRGSWCGREESLIMLLALLWTLQRRTRPADERPDNPSWLFSPFSAGICSPTASEKVQQWQNCPIWQFAWAEVSSDDKSGMRMRCLPLVKCDDKQQEQKGRAEFPREIKKPALRQWELNFQRTM